MLLGWSRKATLDRRGTSEREAKAEDTANEPLNGKRICFCTGRQLVYCRRHRLYSVQIRGERRFKGVFTRFMQFNATQTLAIYFYEPRSP
jgi:hypothetical protein